MLLKRIAVFIFPILVFLGLELSFYINIRYIYIPFLAVILLLVFFLKYIIDEKLLSSGFLSLIVLPVLLVLAAQFFILILSSVIIKHIIIIICSLLLVLYFDSLFLFYYRPDKYHPHSLENLSSFLNLLLFFLVAINLNALNIFLNLSLWTLSLILIAILSLLLLQAFWINKVKDKLKYLYLFIINIIIIEFFWGLSFLPTNFYVNSIILTILFYLTWGITKSKMNQKLDRRLIWRYLVIGCLLLFCVVMTNSWT